MAGINRDYWLEFSKDRVSKSLDSRDTAANAIDTFLSWLWLIYTSVFALASLFDYLSDDILQTALVAQPILIIMISRYWCLLVVMPVSKAQAEADPNVVTEIIDSFKVIVNEKKERLNRAKTWALISIISLCIALISYNVFDPNKNIKTDLKRIKLQKELYENTPKKISGKQLFMDSVKSENDSLDIIYLNTIKRKKLECLKTSNKACIDTLKQLEK